MNKKLFEDFHWSIGNRLEESSVSVLGVYVHPIPQEVFNALSLEPFDNRALWNEYASNKQKIAPLTTNNLVMYYPDPTTEDYSDKRVEYDTSGGIVYLHVLQAMVDYFSQYTCEDFGDHIYFEGLETYKDGWRPIFGS